MTNTKMSELQTALNRYGETSVENYKIIHPIGEKIISGFGDYLGIDGCVFGAPPTGDFRTDGCDYNDAKFSTYSDSPLSVGTISMGLLIRIPHTKDSGSFWLRVVLDLLIEGKTLSVQIGDGKVIRGLPLTAERVDLQPVFDEIFAYVRDMFANPVDYFSAEQSGKIGFLSS